MTNGVVSIVVGGEVAMKLVVGHDGMNAHKVAERIRQLGHLPSLKEAREIAVDEDFGCPKCLVVGTPDDPFNNDDMRDGATKDEPLGMGRYWTTFADPRANPRWEHEAAYTEVVEL